MANAEVQTIDREAVKQKMNEENIQIVNVLSPEHYSLGFIPGSKKIPLNELEERQQELDKNKETIVYCAGPQCHASRNAAELLSEQGFKVKAFEGGIQEWKQAGYPVKED